MSDMNLVNMAYLSSSLAIAHLLEHLTDVHKVNTGLHLCLFVGLKISRLEWTMAYPLNHFFRLVLVFYRFWVSLKVE